LANDPQGWAKFGHPEWGPSDWARRVPILHQRPEFHRGEYYAATNKSTGLTREDLARPDVDQLVSSVEKRLRALRHTTLTFLEPNGSALDQRDSALTYTSARRRREKSGDRLQSGNPDGELQPGEVPRHEVPLVADLSQRGHALFRQSAVHPQRTLGQRRPTCGALLFQDYLLRPENQTKVFDVPLPPATRRCPRPGTDRGRERRRSQRAASGLDVPAPDVLTEILDRWQTQPEDGPPFSFVIGTFPDR